MADILSLLVPAIIIGLVAAWWAMIRRRPKRPKAVAHDEPMTFTRIGEA